MDYEVMERLNSIIPNKVTNGKGMIIILQVVSL